MTSHNQAEIDHIRLVFFQFRVEKERVFHLVFSFLFVLMPSGLRANHSESEGSTQLCLSYFDLQPRHKIIYN